MTGSRVFISYSSKDREIVEPLADLLRGAGKAVWRDKTNLAFGRDWDEQARNAIAGSSRVLVFWSKNAAKSKSVRLEYRHALGTGKPVVPVLLDGTPLPPDLERKHGVVLRRIILSEAAKIGAGLHVKKSAGIDHLTELSAYIASGGSALRQVVAEELLRRSEAAE